MSKSNERVITAQSYVSESFFSATIDDLFQDLSAKYAVSCDLVFGLRDSGITRRSSGNMFGPESVYIREPDMTVVNHKKRLFSDVFEPGYSLGDFLRIIYAIKHEERHLQQYKAISEGKCYDGLTDDKVSYIAKEVLAMTNNGTYYHQGYTDPFYDNGSHMLMELDAQQYAIRSLYSYCEKEYGRDKAEDLVFDIITSELFVLSDHRKSSKDYIEIPRDKIKYDEEESKWVVKDFTCNDVLKLYEEEINRTLIENRRRYITRDSYYIPELHAYKGEDKKLLPVKDSVFEWLENNVDNTFDFSTFPDYFGTSGDVDKFVIIVTDCILKQRGNDRDLKSIVEKTDCIKNESFVWNEQIFIDMFQNEKPNHQFSFDKYKMKQDLERRLQTVQDNAEDKGLISNEEINIERGGIE